MQDADDVVGVLAVDGIAAVPVLAARGLDLLEGRRDGQEDDPRARHHRFADRRLAEGEDGVQELALLALEAALLAREVDDALDVVPRDVRRRVDAERAEDPARDGREEARHGREKAHEELHRADEEERDLLGAPRGDRLGRHLRDDEKEHGRQDRRDEDAPLLAEGGDREAGAERARGRVRERVADEERSDRAREVVPQPLEPLGFPLARIPEPEDGRLGEGRDRRLGRGEERGRRRAEEVEDDEDREGHRRLPAVERPAGAAPHHAQRNERLALARAGDAEAVLRRRRALRGCGRRGRGRRPRGAARRRGREGSRRAGQTFR